MNHAIIGATAAGIATIFTHPIDTIVVSIQTQGKSKQLQNLLSQSIKTFSKSLSVTKTGKLARMAAPLLFRGLGWACFGNMVSYGLLMGVYGGFQDQWGVSPNVAAVYSAVPESFIRGPSEAFKVLRQVGGCEAASTSGAVTKGIIMTLARELPGNVLYFGTYEYLKGPSISQQVFAGGCAGVVIAGFGYPFDTLRSRWICNLPLRFPTSVLRGLPMACGRVGLYNVFFFTSRYLITERLRKQKGLPKLMRISDR